MSWDNESGQTHHYDDGHGHKEEPTDNHALPMDNRHVNYPIMLDSSGRMAHLLVQGNGTLTQAEADRIVAYVLALALPDYEINTKEGPVSE